MEALFENNLLNNLKSITGTSSGAFFALCYTLKYTLGELKEILLRMDMKKMVCIDEENIFNYINNFGLDNGSHYKRIISIIVNKKINKSSVTFRELYEYNSIKLNIVVTNLNDLKTEIFNYENTPDRDIAEATYISSCFPFYFIPHKEIFQKKSEETSNETSEKTSNETSEKTSEKTSDETSDETSEKTSDETSDEISDEMVKLYIDGAITNHYPIDFYNDKIDNTLGFIIYNDKAVGAVDNLFSFAYSILLCMAEQLTQYKLANYKKNSVILKTDISTLDFKLNYDTKLELIKLGYDTTSEYLKTSAFKIELTEESTEKEFSAGEESAGEENSEINLHNNYLFQRVRSKSI